MRESRIKVEYIASQIRAKGCTPVIGNQLILDLLFGKNSVAQAWADEINYPLADGHNLTRVAQFLSVQEKSPEIAKWSYLEFLKRRLLDFERMKPDANVAFLEDIKKQVESMSFTELAIDQLHYPNFTEQTESPLSILASLNIPVYVTTSHHCFLEAALKAVGKSPRTEVYSWREGLNIPEEVSVDLAFEPTVETPLVHHLHGIDSASQSLVLTEDDHFDFLVSITRDFTDTRLFPSSVRKAMSNTVLLLLGYEIHGWDLKTIFKVLMENTPKHPLSVAIQFDPTDSNQIRDIELFRKYLQDYFDRVKFEVVWATTEEFMATLWQKLQ